MRLSIGYRSLRFFVSEQWTLVRDIFSRIGDLVRPRIELIRTRLKRSRVESRKEHLLELLGEEAAGSGIPTSVDWPEQIRQSDRVRSLYKRIGSLEKLENKLRTEAQVLEETGIVWLLNNLATELSARKLEVKTHWVQEHSPLLGLSVAEIRQQLLPPGFIPLLAYRGVRSVELSEDTPLQQSDMLVYLSSAQGPSPFGSDSRWQLYSRM